MQGPRPPPKRRPGAPLQRGKLLAEPGPEQEKELEVLKKAGVQVRESGLLLHAGHGLTYRNVVPVASIEGMHGLNIGHSIVARAIMVGFEQAVREMKRLVS